MQSTNWLFVIFHPHLHQFRWVHMRSSRDHGSGECIKTSQIFPSPRISLLGVSGCYKRHCLLEMPILCAGRRLSWYMT
jgi:hypothetical protein